MAVDSVKCATLSSETSSSSSPNSTNRADCSVFDRGVMTNVCSPGLAHGAQSQSPTRPESASPSPDSGAEADSSHAVTSSPTSAAQSTITNSSAMQQLNETDINSSPSARLASDSAAAKPTSSTDQSAMSPNQSPVNGDRPDDEHRSEPAEPQAKADESSLSDEEPVNRPSSRDSRTSHTAASPPSQNHNEASDHSPPADKETDDRKEVSQTVFKENVLSC